MTWGKDIFLNHKCNFAIKLLLEIYKVAIDLDDSQWVKKSLSLLQFGYEELVSLCYLLIIFIKRRFRPSLSSISIWKITIWFTKG